MSMMIRSSLLLPLLALSLASCGERLDRSATEDEPVATVEPQQRATIDARPVQIGFDGPRFDACAGFGRVINLNPNGDNYLAVHAAPSSSAEEVDRLGPGRGVSMCQQVGDWIGIVYAPDAEEPIACGTGSPVPDRREYDGPCKQGWVDENYLKLVAG